MSPEVDLTVHLVLAATAAYVVVLMLKHVIVAVAKMCGITDKQPWERIGDALDTLMPVLPCIPSGFFFVLWPSEMILNTKIAQFLAGMVAGSFAANIYGMVKRHLGKQILRRSNGPKP